jgi:hypothetical protein
MGRPLKIAKATLLTMTSTAASGNLVTVSQSLYDLNIIAGMPFTIGATHGGLTAGTQYWILQVVSEYTFTVSATDLSQNINFTPVTLSDYSAANQTLSIGWKIDTGFQNPDTAQQSGNTSTNPGASYGVVGGNTGIYGPQVLANIAIGANGTGTVLADTGSNIVTGYGTDFANLATGTTLYALWGDGTGTPMKLGVASSTHGNLTVAVANTQNTGNIIGTTGNAETLVIGSPVTFTANLGGLHTGTTYWVLDVTSTSAFTVSLTPGGAEVDLSNATGTPDAVQQQVILNAVSANNATGVDGTGDHFVTALHEAGYIVRQKGKTKYLVTGTVTGLTGVCYTANVANTALQPNTMCIIATTDAPATEYVRSVNDYQSEVFPAQVAAGSLSAGTLYTIYSSGTTDWTAVGAASNMTGVTFKATGAGSGTGTAILNNANPDVIATFGTAYAANTYPGTNPITGQTSAVSGQPNPIVTINNA